MAAAPVHDRHAAALGALADRDAVLRALGRDDGEREWRRTFGRFSPDAPAFATLAFERAGEPAEILVVDAYASRPETGDAVALPEADGTTWLVARGVNEDRRLTSLGEILAGPGRRRIVRYRPGRRCTIRVDDPGGTTRYVKVQPSADGAALHRDAVTLWDAAQDGRLGFAVASPDHFDADRHALWQHAIPGEPLKPRLLSPEGVALGEPLGRALATLTTSGLQPAAAPEAWTPLARARSAGGDLARRVPALEATAAAVLRRITALDRAAADRTKRPIHGAPHPAQWLQAGDRLGLVDFDRFALGDPEYDVAVLLAEIEDESRAPAGLDRAILGGFEAVAGPLDRRLLVAYRAAGRLATARRYARAVRPDGPRRAANALATAVAVLDEAGA
jgi:hypothetical protein